MVLVTGPASCMLHLKICIQLLCAGIWVHTKFSHHSAMTLLSLVLGGGSPDLCCSGPQMSLLPQRVSAPAVIQSSHKLPFLAMDAIIFGLGLASLKYNGRVLSIKRFQAVFFIIAISGRQTQRGHHKRIELQEQLHACPTLKFASTVLLVRMLCAHKVFSHRYNGGTFPYDGQQCSDQLSSNPLCWLSKCNECKHVIAAPDHKSTKLQGVSAPSATCSAH